VSLIQKVTISGYRGARDVVLEPASTCVLVGESSSGKSTVLAAIWTLLEAAAPMPTGEDVSRGHTRVHVEAVTGERTLFLDARPPATINLNREGAPPALFFPAHLRPTTLLAPADHPAKRAIGVVRATETNPDGGLSLVRSVAALVDARVRGLVILIEEPELYLSPPAQRHLHRLLRKLSARGRNQILYSTHSPVFLGVDRLDELVLVRHDDRTGTRLVQPEALSQKQASRMSAEIDAERAEIFLSRAVLFVEGRTEKLAFPYVFEALGYDADQEAIAIIDCAGKGNMPLFAEICNACGIPYLVVYDRDAAPGEHPAEAERIANETITRVAGKRRTVMLTPDFEGVTGLKVRRGKPAAALKRFRGGNEDVPDPLKHAVERVVAAARHAPRTTRGA
jgi:energy-coupling factor transporter ATP-binding protein EcfA2